jgi:hypothetical protein
MVPLAVLVDGRSLGRAAGCAAIGQWDAANCYADGIYRGFLLVCP